MSMKNAEKTAAKRTKRPAASALSHEAESTEAPDAAEASDAAAEDTDAAAEDTDPVEALRRSAERFRNAAVAALKAITAENRVEVRAVLREQAEELESMLYEVGIAARRAEGQGQGG